MDKETNPNQRNEFWQAEVLGEIYETDFTELSQWISDGALMPTDKVKRGSLRWIEAGKIPLWVSFFNAKESGIEPPPIQNDSPNTENTNREVYTETQNFAQQSNNLVQAKSYNCDQNDSKQQYGIDYGLPVLKNCDIHPENKSNFGCETCGSAFCPQCRKNYGDEMKVCPMCGAICS